MKLTFFRGTSCCGDYLLSHRGALSTLMPNQQAISLAGGTTMTLDIATPIFDGAQAERGYALNKMCFSFNHAESRAAFVADEDAYCAKFGLDAEQRDAVRKRNVLDLIRAGGNIYYLAKFAGIFGLNVQDVGAQQTGMTVQEFKNMLLERGRA
jgi:protocatechuate 4,5-dioxygenase alpha chain